MKPRKIIITGSLILGLLFVSAWIYGYGPIGNANRYDAWQMGYGHMGAGGMGGMMMIFLWGMVLVILILMINWILGQGRNERISSTSGNGPEEILRRRYAEGTIDKSEFQEKMNDLREAALK